MSVHNRIRNSKRTNRDVQIEIEQAEELFVSARLPKQVLVSIGDIIHESIVHMELFDIQHRCVEVIDLMGHTMDEEDIETELITMQERATSFR